MVRQLTQARLKSKQSAKGLDEPVHGLEIMYRNRKVELKKHFVADFWVQGGGGLQVSWP